MAVKERRSTLRPLCVAHQLRKVSLLFLIGVFSRADRIHLGVAFVPLLLLSAIRSNKDDAKVFHEMDAFLGGDGATIRLVPVRLVMGGAPPAQLPIPAKRPDGEATKTERIARNGCRGDSFRCICAASLVFDRPFGGFDARRVLKHVGLLWRAPTLFVVRLSRLARRLWCSLLSSSVAFLVVKSVVW